MKIKYVKIQNFRSIKNEILEFPENGLISIIGANNAWKSNFLKAIDLVLWESWNNWEKLEDYDYYCWDRSNKIIIEIWFTDWKKVIFNSSEKWPEYFEANWDKKYWNVKEDFPCTYLSAERSIAKDTAFTKWSLMWKLSKSFNKSVSNEQKEELKTHFNQVKTIFNWVENFSNFERDFKQYFDEMQSDSPYKLDINFKPFTPNNYFKSINILASDPNVGNNIDIEELWDWAKNLTIISLLRSYAKNFRDANWILAIEEPEIYLHPQARKHLFEIFKDLTDNWIQVIFTTHDPSFLEIWSFESIRRISKTNDEENTWKQYSKINSLKYDELGEFAKKTWWPSSYTTQWVQDFYKSISNHRLSEWFFSNLIILCEWPTEELIIPKYFDKNWFKYNSKWISILYTTWKWEIPKYWRLFNQFWIPVICLFDNDNSNSGKEKNNKIICDCFNKNIDDFTTWLNDDFFKEIKIDNGKLVILEKDIETVIKKDFLKTSNESDYDELISSVNWTSKSVKALNLVNEILINYWNIPEFIEWLKTANLIVIDETKKNISNQEIPIEDIPF